MLLPKHKRNVGMLLQHHPAAGSRYLVFPGSRLLSKGYWFRLNSDYLADFTQMSHLRMRGTNYFLAACQDGLKQLPPRLFSQPLVPEARGAQRVLLMALQGSVFP